MTLQFSLAAEIEAAAAVDWYEAQREGLGEEFREALARLLENIESAPLRFPKVAGRNRQRHIRQGILRRFPYRVIFEIQDDQDCLVLAVAHTSRHPDYWKRRPT